MSQRLADRAARALAPRTGRRGFLARSAVAGAALATVPKTFILKPQSAYAAVCGCAGQSCACGSLCCDGFTEFCCTMSGQNRCPPGTTKGGWWRVDSSGFCGGGSRYYIDCNANCGSCGCGSGGVCSGSCTGTPCRCAKGSCNNRKEGCNGFRYGQCNQNVRCLGPIVCRVVTCTPPWQTDGACSSAVRVDNSTASHNRPCLSGNPFGNVDTVTPTFGGVRVRGWAIDPDTTSPIRVHVYIDGVGRASVLASGARTDVARAYPGSGANHGFNVVVNGVASGTRSVCVYGISVGAGGNTRLGCRSVAVSGNPIGGLEVAAMDQGRLHVRGWAVDPDTTASLRVHIYDNGKGLASLAADVTRTDIGRLLGKGDAHGFDAFLRIPPGTHTIQAYAINVAGGGNTLIGTRKVTWDGRPFGRLESVTPVGGGRVRVTGWAIDAETTSPIRVHLYSELGGVASIAANVERPDLAGLGFGTAHGFDATVTVGTGSHQICAYAINVGSGITPRLGCQQVTVT